MDRWTGSGGQEEAHACCHLARLLSPATCITAHKRRKNSPLKLSSFLQADHLLRVLLSTPLNLTIYTLCSTHSTPITRRPQHPSFGNNLAPPSSPTPPSLAFCSLAIDPEAPTPYRGALASLSPVLHVGWCGSGITSDPRGETQVSGPRGLHPRHTL